jgi:hypothetical protein
MAMLNLKLNNHEDYKLREQMERRDRHIAALEQKAAILDLQLDQRKSELFALNGELQTQKEHSHNLQAVLSETRDAYSTEFEKQAAYISRLEEDVRGKDEHIRYLETLLQGIESGRVMRLTRALSRFVGK